MRWVFPREIFRTRENIILSVRSAAARGLLIAVVAPKNVARPLKVPWGRAPAEHT